MKTHRSTDKKVLVVMNDTQLKNIAGHIFIFDTSIEYQKQFERKFKIKHGKKYTIEKEEALTSDYVKYIMYHN